MAPIWGRLADRYGRKLMLIRASLGMAVVMSLIGMAHNVWELVALRLQDYWRAALAIALGARALLDESPATRRLPWRQRIKRLLLASAKIVDRRRIRHRLVEDRATTAFPY